MSLNLDLTQVEDSKFGVIPSGTYEVVVDEAVVKSTKSGTGEYIHVSFKITDKECNGRKIFSMFNIKNDNQKAVEIGLQQLKSFMLCAGVPQHEVKLSNASDLMGMKALAVVKSKTDDFGDKNYISYFKPFFKEQKKESKKTEDFEDIRL